MAASCTLPAVGSPSGSGSGGRQRGGVGSGMGRWRPSYLAPAAAAGRDALAGVGHAGHAQAARAVVLSLVSTPSSKQR